MYLLNVLSILALVLEGNHKLSQYLLFQARIYGKIEGVAFAASFCCGCA
jgi:hypothetical protein